MISDRANRKQTVNSIISDLLKEFGGPSKAVRSPSQNVLIPNFFQKSNVDLMTEVPPSHPSASTPYTGVGDTSIDLPPSNHPSPSEKWADYSIVPAKKPPMKSFCPSSKGQRSLRLKLVVISFLQCALCAD